MDAARFGKLWEEWDDRIESGEAPAVILRDAKDEDLVELLGGESLQDRKYVRDVIATELLNRLRARSTHPPAAASVATRSAQDAHEEAQKGQEAIHRAEGILKHSGQWDLGASISASAYRSLDATQAAFEAAENSATAIQESLARSRVAAELADEAAQAAEDGLAITEKLEKHMEEIGRGEAGRDAKDASLAISTAADAAADASRDGGGR